MALQLLKDAKERGIHIYMDGDKLKVKAPPGAMTDEFRQRIKQKKSALIELFQELNEVSDADDSGQIKALGNKQSVLSYPQQIMWFAEQMASDKSQYVVSRSLKLFGELNIDGLQKALDAVVARHEILRTTFVESDEGPVQLINDVAAEKIKVIDLTTETGQAQEDALYRLLDSEATCGFDLTKDQMLRMTLVKLQPQEFAVFFTMHHIASDAWSTGLLISEFMQYYTGFIGGTEVELAPLPIQYADYAQWQTEHLQGEVFEQQLAYWREQLNGIPMLHRLPIDGTRPIVQTTNGKIYGQHIDAAMTDKLMALNKQQNVTLFILLETAFAVLLGRYSNEQDIVIGTPVAGRDLPQVQPLIGFFVNNLVLRSKIDLEQRFVDLLADSKAMVLAAYKNQSIPYMSLIEQLQHERSLAHSPLFQIVFGLNNTPKEDLDLPGLKVGPLGREDTSVPVDLELVLNQSEDGIVISWLYNVDLFNESSIVQMAAAYQRLLQSILVAPQTPVGEYPLFDEKQSAWLDQQAKGPVVDYPALSFHQRFAQQVAQTPDAVALTFAKDSLTYRQLDECASRLAASLDDLEIEPGSHIGICLERSTALMIAVLGVMKGGYVYVALEPGMPAERLAFMIDDAQIELVLIDTPAMTEVSLGGVDIMMMDGAGSDERWLEDFADSGFSHEVEATALAYVLYTSGSTGQPKGVQVPHCSLMNYLNHALNHYLDDAIKGSVVSSPLCFDATITTLLSPLLAGRTVHIIPDGDDALPLLVDKLYQTRTPLLFKITPAHLAAVALLVEQGKVNPTAHKIVVGGEQLCYSTLASYRGQSLPNATFINEYGPTETVVGCSTYCLPPLAPGEVPEQSRNDVVPIGKPINNCCLLVLSSSMQVQPINSVGELYIGGDGVALGYINRDDLTEACFVVHPEDANLRLYRTGDLVRWLDSGELEFVGRVDHQVKVRGFRIELGEIESVLGTLEQVQDAVVLARADDPQNLQDVRLVAYVVPKSYPVNEDVHGLQLEKAAMGAAVLDSLQSALPDYMIPSVCVVLKSIPLTANGKVDTRSLPAPEDSDLHSQAYAAPANPTEQALCEVWQQVLKVEKVGVEDNFFRIGGDSILGIRIVSMLKSRELLLSIQDIFRYQSVRQLAEHIQASGGSTVQVKEVEAFSLLSDKERELVGDQYEDVYPMSALQVGMVFHTQVEGFNGIYHDINAEHVKYPWSRPHFEQALAACIQHHPILRTGFQMDGERPLQHVHKQTAVPLEVEDISHLDIQGQAQRLKQWRDEHRRYQFDWKNGRLFQINIFLRDAEHFEFVVSFHHSILDGWSRASLTTELYEYYQKLLAGESIEVPSTDWIYREYIAQELHAIETDGAKNFFVDELAVIPGEQIPRRRDGDPQSAGIEQQRYYNVDSVNSLSKGLITLSQQLGVPLQAVGLAAHLRVLSALSGQSRVLTCVVNNARPEREGAELGLGLFLNSLPLSLDVADISWCELIIQVAGKMADTMAHRYYPLMNIQEDVSHEFSDILFNYTHFHLYNELQEDQESEELELLGSTGVDYTNFDFTVDMSRSVDGENVSLSFTYNNSCYADEQIAHIGDYYETVLAAMVNNLSQNCMALSLVSEKERKLFSRWNETQYDYPVDSCVHQLFEAEVAKKPDAVAVMFEQQQLSYAELNSKANRLANYLVESGIEPGERIALFLERSVEILIAVLGTMKVGATYVPIDVNFPPQRVKSILEDAEIALVLLLSEQMEALPLGGVDVLLMDDASNDDSWMEEYPDDALEDAPDLSAKDLLYILYTSGSTGRPKGVAIPHQGVVNYLYFAKRNYLDGDIQGGVVSSPLCFDATLTTLLAPLMAGKIVRLLPEGDETIPLLAELLFGQTQDWLFKITPAHLDVLSHLVKDPKIGSAAHKIVVGGEQLTFQTLWPYRDKLLPNAIFINEYGPTETVVGCSTFTVLPKQANEPEPHPGVAVPIGRAVDNTRLYVMSPHNQEQPLNSIGELYIGGDGLAQGYIGRDDLTEAVFVEHPLINGERLYRTWDLVRWLPDGNLEFIGRVDQQVKVRGFRIELSEIESCLLQDQNVREALVVATVDEGDQGHDKLLLAYIVCEPPEKEGSALDEEAKKALATDCLKRLTTLLPFYMVPSACAVLEEMPLTRNGKINFNALPQLKSIKPQQQAQDNAVQTKTEQILCGMWQDVLNVPKVAVTDNFFDLGGNSIRAIRLINQIDQEFSFNFPMKTLFQLQTVQDLATHLDFLIAQDQAVDQNDGDNLDNQQEEVEW